MKKLIFLISILLVSGANVEAQRYSVIKKEYDYHLYTPQPGDPYNPVISGVCSFLVPGLGQMIDGEVGRGLGFMAGTAGCILIFGTGEIFLVKTIIGGMEGENTNTPSTLGLTFIYVGLGGMTVLDIWSIIDATHIAKVKNMYRQDHGKANLSLELKPYIESIAMNNRVTIPVGLSLMVSF